MASDMRKPDGMFVIPPGKGKEYVSGLAIGKFHGIGPATAERMMSLGIGWGADLERVGEAFLVEHFGKSGAYFHRLALGIDDRPVNPERVRKSIGAENTLDREIVDHEVARAETLAISDKVWERCAKHGARGKTVTLKVKYEDFEELSRSRSSTTAHVEKATFVSTALGLLDGLFPVEKGIRLIGVTMSGLVDDDDETSPQMSLFG